MQDTIFALMRAYDWTFAEARDIYINACLGDEASVRAVAYVTPLGAID